MAAPCANPPFTLTNAMFDCGITDAVLFDGDTKASRIDTELFDDNFASCMDNTYVKLDDDLKSYSNLTAAHGQIRLTPGGKKNIKVFIQWTRDQICLGIDPITVRFPVSNASGFIKRYKHHDSYVKKSKTITETAKPENFTDKIKWIDWYPTFIIFIRAIPGSNGIPLSCICIPVSAIIPTMGYGDFIDEYVEKTPLTRQAHLRDAAEVHTYIIKFILGNPVAEAKMVQNAQKNYERLDFIALNNHYEGVGVHTIDIVKADKIIQDLFYSRDKKPHMRWDEF